MDKPTQIGKCIGCDRMRRLDDRICGECWDRGRRHTPDSARKWAEMSHQCRTNPGFALKVYNSIPNTSGKKLFILMYGLPEDGTPPDTEDSPPARKAIPSLVK